MTTFYTFTSVPVGQGMLSCRGTKVAAKSTKSVVDPCYFCTEVVYLLPDPLEGNLQIEALWGQFINRRSSSKNSWQRVNPHTQQALGGMKITLTSWTLGVDAWITGIALNLTTLLKHKNIWSVGACFDAWFRVQICIISSFLVTTSWLVVHPTFRGNEPLHLPICSIWRWRLETILTTYASLFVLTPSLPHPTYRSISLADLPLEFLPHVGPTDFEAFRGKDTSAQDNRTAQSLGKSEETQNFQPIKVQPRQKDTGLAIACNSNSALCSFGSGSGSGVGIRRTFNITALLEAHIILLRLLNQNSLHFNSYSIPCVSHLEALVPFCS